MLTVTLNPAEEPPTPAFVLTTLAPPTLFTTSTAQGWLLLFVKFSVPFCTFAASSKLGSPAIVTCAEAV